MQHIWLPDGVERALAHTPRYTDADMVALARALGLRATAPTLREWVRLGLVGKPTNGRWTPQQADLWIRLLRERSAGARIGGLCNIPVGGWIYFGEAYGGVSLGQAQRAMQTWAERQTVPSLDTARRTAQRLVSFVKTKDARLVREAKAKLNDVLARGVPDEEVARDVFTLLIEGRRPEKRGQSKGPVGAAVSVDLLLDVWRVRRETLARLGEMDDWMWEWARVALHVGIAEYNQRQPAFAAQARAQYPDLERHYGVAALEALIGAACVDLLTLLGIAFEDGPAAHPIPGLPPALQLQPWRDGLLTGRVDSRIVTQLGRASLHTQITILPTRGEGDGAQ